MRYTLYSENDAFLRRLFLDFPRRLYPPERLTQEPKTERQLLLGTHPLSGAFDVFPFLALDDSGQPAARCLLTLYPGDVILTGSPVGSALLTPGDVVESQIDGIGLLVNPVREQAV